MRDFIKVKVSSRRVSYRTVFYSVLFLTFMLRFVFVLTAMDTIDGENKCSSIGTMHILLCSFLCSIRVFLVCDFEVCGGYIHVCHEMDDQNTGHR